MTIKRSTYVPNILFDHHLPRLSLAELRLLLIIIRQTNGWLDTRTGKRKTRDRINHSQFMSKTGLSRQTISATLNTLQQNGLIKITDWDGNLLGAPEERKGKKHLYYAITDLEHVRSVNTTCKISVPEHVRSGVYNKTNPTKEKETKGFRSIRSILKRWYKC